MTTVSDFTETAPTLGVRRRRRRLFPRRWQRLGLSALVVVSLSSLAAMPSSAWALPTCPPGFVYCATEGQDCQFAASPPTWETEVAYGANGTFVYWPYANSPMHCTNDAFHGDPLQGVLKACFTIVGPPGFSYCSAWGGSCRVDNTSVVALGSGTNFTYHDHISGKFTCDVATLGGPAPNTGGPAACFVLPDQPGYNFCAIEGGTCKLSSTDGIEYGTGGTFSEPLYLGGNIPCTDATFGGSPVAGVSTNACFSEMVPSGFTYCATDGGTCHLQAPSDVAYGAAGSFIYAALRGDGYVACTNEGFGSDPTPWVVKACFAAPDQDH